MNLRKKLRESIGGIIIATLLGGSLALTLADAMGLAVSVAATAAACLATALACTLMTLGVWPLIIFNHHSLIVFSHLGHLGHIAAPCKARNKAVTVKGQCVKVLSLFINAKLLFNKISGHGAGMNYALRTLNTIRPKTIRKNFKWRANRNVNVARKNIIAILAFRFANNVTPCAVPNNFIKGCARYLTPRCCLTYKL